MNYCFEVELQQLWSDLQVGWVLDGGWRQFIGCLGVEGQQEGELVHVYVRQASIQPILGCQVEYY